MVNGPLNECLFTIAFEILSQGQHYIHQDCTFNKRKDKKLSLDSCEASWIREWRHQVFR